MSDALHTRTARIEDVRLGESDEDRVLFIELSFTDEETPRDRVYLMSEREHGNERLHEFLTGIGYTGEKRMDRLFVDLVGQRLRARIDEDGSLLGVGHAVKNQFTVWEEPLRSIPSPT